MDLKTLLFSRSSSDKSQLGLFWGKDSFSLAETAKGLPDKVIHIRFDAPVPGDQGQKIPETLRLTALLQQAIREKKIVSKKVNLSLSIKDVIYRSFVIPFMQPNEVKNVVDFEATKYIPIKLDELAYTYHAMPFTDGDQKNLRILFVAARKSILEKYCGILQQSGLEAEFIEPASVSLLRLLQKQGHVPRQQATAVIEVEPDGGGRITVIDKEIIQFVREFQSPVEGAGIPSENIKFFNDIRVSFNFYQRQNAQAKLDRLVILANADFTALANGLGQEFKAPAVALTISKVLKAPEADMGSLNASGASIREKVVASKNFDLSMKSTRTGKSIGDPKNAFAEWNLKVLGFSLGISATLIYGTSFLTTAMLTNARRTSAGLEKQLGIYASSDSSSLADLRSGVVTKLNQYKDVQIKSDITYYLKKIPNLLPKGAWLNNFSIDYYESVENSDTGPRRISKVALGLDGFVYLPDTNDQIRQVNALVAKMKSNKSLSKLFTDITLATVKQEMSNNYPATYFRITCK